MVPKEFLLSQGIPVYPCVTNGVVTNNFQLHRVGRTRVTIISQAGNAMHINCFGVADIFGEIYLDRLNIKWARNLNAFMQQYVKKVTDKK